MNFYSFHIGDYASATRHLTWLEDAAYRRLLDVYYVKEGPLPTELRQVYRLVVASTQEQREAVDIVLEEFFTLTEVGYTHMRCEHEIGCATDKRNKAAQSARARWGNAKPGDAALPPQSEGNANAPNDACERMKNECEGNAPNPNPNPNPIEKDAGEPAAPAKPARPSRGSKILKTYLAECKAAGQKPIPDDHHVRSYCRDAGITEDMAAIAWLRFREEHTVGTRKTARYDDWPAAFANSVKACWYRLWVCNTEGEANWTSLGLQARRVIETQQREREEAAA